MSANESTVAVPIPTINNRELDQKFMAAIEATNAYIEHYSTHSFRKKDKVDSQLLPIRHCHKCTALRYAALDARAGYKQALMGSIR